MPIPALLAAILAGVALEAAALLLFHARTGRGPAPRALLPNLGAGACLLGAALAAAEGVPWFGVAACLAGSLACHVLDLRARWNG